MSVTAAGEAGPLLLMPVRLETRFADTRPAASCGSASTPTRSWSTGITRG